MVQKTMNLKITNSRLIGGEETIEGIMCFATLFSNKVEVKNVEDSLRYYNSLGFNGCPKCPFVENCAACDINR